MAARSANTMAEGLPALLDQITAMKMTPDADLDWLINLETHVLGKVREPFQRMQQQGLTNAGGGGGGQGGMPPMGNPNVAAGITPSGMPNAGMDPGMMGGGAQPAPPTGAGAGVPGVRTEPQMPPVDELRRMLSQG